jgi:hypothetical protein
VTTRARDAILFREGQRHQRLTAPGLLRHHAGACSPAPANADLQNQGKTPRWLLVEALIVTDAIDDANGGLRKRQRWPLGCDPSVEVPESVALDVCSSCS